MSEKNHGSFYYIIPAEVMHDKNLTPEEKIFYALISGLANKHGYCFASNEWFEKEMGIKERSIQRCLKSLEKFKYISKKMVPLDNNPFKKQRHIYINATFKNSLPGVKNADIENREIDTLESTFLTGIISEEKKIISKEKKSAAPPPSAEASDLFDIFFQQIKERCPNFKKPQGENWAREFDAMIINDKRNPVDIAEVCRWVHTHSFWKANCLSPSSLRKNFDKISMQMKSSAELDLQENNRRFAIDLKKKYPDRLKNLTINPKYVININTGKDLLYTLREETFRHTLCHMFGGTYEPNRSAEQRSEVEPDSTD